MGEETGEDGNESKVGTEGKAVDELLSFHSTGRARDGLETGNERQRVVVVGYKRAGGYM